MARLNDLPTSSDSIESLKRRFIRQNREIARANSVQSIRIRTLEAEVSHLLAENVTLREGIISANHELERYRTGTHFENRINTLRERFESGLGELSALVKDLNKLPSQYCDVGERVAKEDRVEKEGEIKRISPRSLLRLSEDEAMLEDGGCLPAIPEDGVYAPDADERIEEEIIQEDDDMEPVQAMDNIESTERKPEARTQEQDVSVTSKNTPSDESRFPWATRENTVAEILEKVRPINTRPKRRDSSLVQTLVSKKDVEVDRDAAPPATVAGSKRKFDAQECDALPQDKQEQDKFQYTLFKKAQRQLSNEIGVGAENEADPISTGKESLKPRADLAKSRRALGPKNVNFNPRSTTKKVVQDSVAVEKRKGSGRRKTETRNTSRPKTSDQPTDTKPEVFIREDVPLFNHPVEISLDDHDPVEKTSESTNSLDKPLYSEYQPTTTSERHAQRPRPSRRSRGPINYAEPSLRGKMRRPTEDLVDAVAECTTKRLSRSQNDLVDDLQSEQRAIRVDINPNLSKGNQSSTLAHNIFDLSTSSPDGKLSMGGDSNYTSDNDTDTDGTWSSREHRARSMRAPTPDPSIRPVRQSRRQSSNPNYRVEAHISA
ncbi:shugoshin C terminal domain-containing protein [Arthroderma uncinatum]|uniref:shugoshin C terminal domain-containing protein n=1 Tax=Arthroderma uncinatum TaxID=74035 RepID=UPI00144AC2CE|nr:shugoshin C terminal domain-containing protein [Arthroderma uncinatum]KAF3492070.1 shugoshin C terminal domain-containing protein [Arthroderma uncinatum]